jgi:DNA (cytosine-5)-methyltransferase 1
VKVLDLFSGIGGFSLGLERAGMKTIAFCEIDEKCRQVLKKHWPDVPQYKDIKTLSREKLKNDGIEKPDVICGGFPCQDISIAGPKHGINGERSGLWLEFRRIISELRPKFAVIENVANLLIGERGAWFSNLLSDLAEIGYDAEWFSIPASSIGANHNRERVWIVSYSKKESLQVPIYSKIPRDIFFECQPRGNSWRAIPGTYWEADQPPICQLDDGVPGWVDGIKQLGNSVVPQIPELIGKAILSIEDLKL